MKEHNSTRMRDNQLCQRQLDEVKRDSSADVVKKSFTIVGTYGELIDLKKEMLIDKIKKPNSMMQVIIVVFFTIFLLYLCFPQLFY